MNPLFSNKLARSALAMIIALPLAACQAPASTSKALRPPQVSATAGNITERELSAGLYELTYSAKAHALFAATAQSFKDVNGGVIYRLDPATLAILGQTHTDLKNFGMTSNAQGDTLYVTQTLDSSVSAIDAVSGKVKARLTFKDKNPDGKPVNPREIIWHDGTLYIGGVGDPGIIWIVDANTLQLKGQINHAGKWVTGLLWSQATQRLYAANGSGEIMVINPRSHKIEARWTPDDGQKHMFLNLAEDAQSGRLFATDNSAAKNTLVFDQHSGKVIKQLDVGDSLAIKFNPQRNEIYITQRESGKLLQLDASSYALKHSWDLKPNPNSLLLSEDGQTLYVTVKQAFNKDHSSKGLDKLLRIKLN